MDFTIQSYVKLLSALIAQQYCFQTFEQFLRSPLPKSIILRHDVDLLPKNSLTFARIQHHLNIKGVYYFRAVPESWNEEVMREIADMGHEIGYHYESLTTCQGDMVKGIQDFEKNLTRLRKIAPVSTICMHGSPMSPYDSKDLWKIYDYRSYGIIGEPYFDIDFSNVLYLTDTGRQWDGAKLSVRDKVESGFDLAFHNTLDIISAAEKGILPDKIMFTFHPQRWNDNIYLWTKELLAQNVKNIVKQYFFIK